MKRLFNWGVLVAVSLLLLALSASAGTGPAAGKAKPVKPQTLVVENGLIRAFAQDGNSGSREHHLADLRREELQRKCDLIEDDRRQRHHQNQQSDWERKKTQVLGSEKKQDRAGEHADE